MTWVTVQSHDIGDTFSGIYALERVFSVGGADGICACDQKQERGVCVCVCAVWDQSQERLQVVAALSGRRSKGVGRSFASAASSREKAAFGVAASVGQSAPSASELGSKKVAAAVAKGFSWNAAHPGGEHVGALAGGVGFGEEAPAKGAAQTGLDGEGSTRAQSLQRSVDSRLQGLVSYRHGKRCEALTVRDLFSRYVLAVVLLPNQSDAAVRRAMVQIFRRYGLPKIIRVDNGAPFGGKGALGLSRLSVWWLRLGIVVEFVRPAHPERQRCARTNASGLARRCRQAARAQRRGAKTTPPRLDAVLQSSTSSRSIGPARSCKDLLAEQSADAGAIVAGGIYLWVAEPAGAQSRPHQMARPRALYRPSLCWATGETQNSGRWCPRSLFPAATHRVALRARSVRNATGCNRATSLTRTACPPLEPKIAAVERAPEQTAAPPSSYLLVCSGARSTRSNAKV